MTKPETEALVRSLKLTEEEGKFIVDCLDFRVRNQGLSVAGKSLGIAAKIQLLFSRDICADGGPD